MKYSIIQSTVGNQHIQVENEREQRKLGTESRVTVSNKSGNWGVIAVYSFQLVKNSLLQISVKEISL